MNLSRRACLAAAALAASVALAACGGGSPSGQPTGTSAVAAADNHQPLTILIGTSGDAETAAVKSAVEAWSKKSGTPATVNVASDLNQQLSQGFSGGNPPDLFYVTNDSVATYAGNGSLEPYVDQLKNKDAFYPSLVKAFTVNGKSYAAPKDFSTLELVINTDMWKAAGLGDADIPTTWDQLESVAKKLTTGQHVGLAVSPQFERLGVFMAQAGGWLTDDSGKAAANSDANVQGLAFAKKLLADGAMKYSSQLGAGWGGEAFGTQKAAMTIEGNWISGAMGKDYKSVNYRVAKLPAGPKGEGTIQYDGGWGMAAQSKNKGGAIDLVTYLTQPEQQMGFAKAFGVMPSVQSIADQWKAAFPGQTAFLDGAASSKSIPSVAGISDVIKDFDSQLDALPTTEPKTILEKVQTNLSGLAGLS
ncbi:extracellular solute-binding protein [Sinomonas sp. JGH33]|uniref:Extracellular solute-binding protein n=1 Tax=Sinomonas terricola TaxID=3110330 RepID=A0ABU5T4E1_9MICC|nr:extracellular solute-binding protein [Sinomonas sp. JGH33]MEA5454011.1 extracellular solute-binding protein [Sinomonas sp. JGH33]